MGALPIQRMDDAGLLFAYAKGLLEGLFENRTFDPDICEPRDLDDSELIEQEMYDRDLLSRSTVEIKLPGALTIVLHKSAKAKFPRTGAAAGTCRLCDFPSRDGRYQYSALSKLIFVQDLAGSVIGVQRSADPTRSIKSISLRPPTCCRLRSAPGLC